MNCFRMNRLNRFVLLSLLFSLTLVLSGCWLFLEDDREYPLPDLTNDNINVMLERPGNWERLVEEALFDEWNMKIIDGSTATIPITAELLRQFYEYSDSDVRSSGYVHHTTTHSAYLRLIDRVDEIGIIFVTPPSSEELSYAEQQGVELEIRPIARDGFVFITHKDNPINSLTVKQIQDIYSGKITNWKDLGGNDEDIYAYQREPNSGSQTAMEQLVMEGIEMVAPITTKTQSFRGMGRLVDAVAEYQNGPKSIGYTYNYYINNLYKNDNIKVIEVNGVLPSNENLIRDVYPFTTAYYGVVRADALEDSSERRLLDYLETRIGQSIVEMAGYCPYYEFED